ncbi:MAG: DUF1501 domain-containing protein [Saccharospirillaceae bacterium]|nr:DUF1501 domain-containing protein [Pseudomonadales bacterium]NRB81165.1 DUF1501 domain-containing protein [Saccharospirillaceae bacterium]
MKLQRRNFLQMMAAAGLTAQGTSSAMAAQASYDGPIYICISAEGGWDVTSLCDPKTSFMQDGEQVWVNNWAKTQSAQTIGGINYAPFAQNQSFFTNHASKMKIVNGIDSQTNAHQVGVRHNWSGRIADGFPAFTALVAKIKGDGLPLAFLSNGGYRETAGLIPFTLMNNPNTLRALINTNDPGSDWQAQHYTHPRDMNVLESAKAARLQRLLQGNHNLPKKQKALEQMQSAIAGKDQLLALEAHIPEELVSPTLYGDTWNPLLQQAQMVLASAKAGLTVAADLVLGGFDTHATHDVDQEEAINALIHGVDYLWEEATRLGLENRLRVFITSDFSRTPQYNDGDGKDHWPIGSAIFMQKNPTWSTAVLGETDEGHNAKSLNADLTVANNLSDGVIIQPKHVQQLLRTWADIENDPISLQFDLDSGDLDLTGALIS